VTYWCLYIVLFCIHKYNCFKSHIYISILSYSSFIYQMGFWWLWKVTYSFHASHHNHDVSYIVHLSTFLICRLGHDEQKDEWQPRLVQIFQKNNILGPNDIISAGSASSACTAGGTIHVLLCHAPWDKITRGVYCLGYITKYTRKTQLWEYSLARIIHGSSSYCTEFTLYLELILSYVCVACLAKIITQFKIQVKWHWTIELVMDL
jgi:hypothetical protein